MRVLILSQHFAPEITAARVRLQAFAQGLAAIGHDVEVIAEVPNHPEGVIRPGYRRRAQVKEEMDGYSVRYVWVRARPHKTTFNRLALYASYAGMAAMAGSLARRPDVALASSPPLPVGAAGAVVAARHRVPWVLDVRDLWPEVAIALGELRGRRPIQLARGLERRLYRSAAAIVTVNEPFRRDIAAKVDQPDKIRVIPNGTTQEWLDAGELQVDRRSVGLPEEGFVWAYAGNVGLAQGLDTAIEAAALLGQGFRLVIVGAGPLLASLRQQAAASPDAVVEFRDPVEVGEARRLLRAADALLVPLGTQPGLEKFVPSKLFDCCAVGRPVIVAATGETPRLAATEGAAVTVSPGDPRALADAVRSLRDDEGLGRRLSESGRRFASQYLRPRQVEQLDEVIRSVVRMSS